MSALRMCLAVAIVALGVAAPAAAQREAMHPQLLEDLRKEEIQKQLVAAGSLDAPVGRASRPQLRKAIEWFRRAHKLGSGVGPLTQAEKDKLADIYKEFEKRTGLARHEHLEPDPERPGSVSKVELLLPWAYVDKEAVRDGFEEHKNTWFTYYSADRKVGIGPVIYPLHRYTPIALFRERIMNVSVKYDVLHLTSEEFTARGTFIDGDNNRHFTHNLALTHRDLLKGLFMRYDARAPATFEVPPFLAAMVATEVREAGASDPVPNATDRAWQLLMQAVTNLIASEFPFKNGWSKVSSRGCDLEDETGDGAPKSIRILFGTDREMQPSAPRPGEVKPVSPGTLFGNRPDHRLRMGCAYVSRPVEGSNADQPILKYHLFHEGPVGDLGDRTYLADEIGKSRNLKGSWARSDALVFIHGYRVSFKDALYAVAKIVADTGYRGRAYLYSWPSVEGTLGYFEDLDNAEQGEPYFQSFMRMLMRDADIYEIDLIAHSMGSQSMLRAVSALRPLFDTERGEGRQRREEKKVRSIRVGQMIFAAADVSEAVFEQKIDRIAPFVDRVTVYASSRDLALSLSRGVRGDLPRVGLILGREPVRIDNGKVHMIDATPNESLWRRLTGGGYGHDYLVQSPDVRADLKDILSGTRDKDKDTPDLRGNTGTKPRFQKVQYENAPGRFYWRLVPQ